MARGFTGGGWRWRDFEGEGKENMTTIKTQEGDKQEKPWMVLASKILLVFGLLVACGAMVGVGVLRATVTNHGEKLKENDERFNKDEAAFKELSRDGSSSLKNHADKDDQRDTDMKERVRRLEDVTTTLADVRPCLIALTERVSKLEVAVNSLGEIKSDLAKISVILQNLKDGQTDMKKSLEDHVKKP